MRAKHILAAVVLACVASVSGAQQPSPPKPPPVGWEFVGLPALNFDSDEGIGYGVLLESYNYGAGVLPYRFTIQPILFLTTKGRRDVVVFFDAPKLLRDGWRLDALVAREQHLATPYYGVGNATPLDEQLEAEPNAYFYRYGRTQFRFLANLQHRVWRGPVRGLFGLGFTSVATDAIPFDSGTTLFAQQFPGAPPRGKSAYLRAGFVWDTRDREIAPSSGSYGDLLVQRVDGLDEEFGYSRITAIARKYLPIASRLVVAQRAVVQQAVGDVPVYDMATIQTSFKQQEGLGGSNTIRGLPKNRFVGKGLVFVNTDVRWRFSEFQLRRKPAALTLSVFYDVGRVWSETIRVDSIARGLHTGYGSGLRLGLGPSFTAALDAARSPGSESTQIYIGLGYPF